MKKTVLTTILTVTSLLAIENLELAKKADIVTDGFESSIAQTEMTLINASGQKSVRELEMKTLEGESADKTISTFLSPADVKGTKTLTHGHIDRDDDQWLYLPALKRVKRIASRNKSGSFMGSEFSYEDIGNQNYQKFTYEGEAEEVELDGVKCYKGARVPKDENSGYTKQITWIDKESLLIQQIEYYDRKKELLKTATFSEYKQIDGVWRMGKIRMKNHQNDKSTILIWKEDKIKAGLTAKEFN
ncbi:outer membrane lipoprotein-sorting protein [Sulfurovum sp. bin170]|uniref:outer membrane lipoprotein-sorting protein n=1 Tax=Sulfurovum sp. bin170 TaxID=2695268 RepID=UPI0013DF8726|nr:outer membrane lipoprotein-sorting protein [Sulfurovum sp. bin170]NEW60908.1 outer membrane lipoprotein-sorting protein [Sulfurovum sp. bin170]